MVDREMWRTVLVAALCGFGGGVGATLWLADPPELPAVQRGLASTDRAVKDLERHTTSLKRRLDAAPAGVRMVHQGALADDVDTIRAALESGQSVDERTDDYYRTPLHLAAMAGCLESIAFLLDEGADLEARDYRGRVPLHLAAEAGRAEAVELLLDRGADIEASEPKFGCSARVLAADKGFLKLAEYLERRARGTAPRGENP